MAKAKKTDSITNEILASLKLRVPESLTGAGKSPAARDHVENAMRLIEWGHPRLAADHFLFPEINGLLPACMSGVLRRLHIAFSMAAPLPGDETAVKTKKYIYRFHAYEFLIETALNFYGHESRLLKKDEKDSCLDRIYVALQSLEEFETRDYGEPVIARAAVASILDGMKRVQGGASMVAGCAVRIENDMNAEESPTCSFLDAAEIEITSNVYYKMVASEYCKFGNDYALGLRWLRHLGFEQVSTNPVLAAKAYEDDPDVEAEFIRSVADHPEYKKWAADPAGNADEIALSATLCALWENLRVYRPVFHNLKKTSGGGVVSFQLNPNIADRAEESVADAMKAYETASEYLRVYDSYLLAGYDGYCDSGRPNMVIKVAASHPAAREIAYTLNSFGIGTNITVVYTVGQQITLILDELGGMATATQRGIVPTQMYMTNMGGRLESHLREVALENLFEKLKKKIGEQKATLKLETFAKGNGSLAKVKAAKTYKEKASIATSYAAQKTIDYNVSAALKDVASSFELAQLESDIAKSGTLVAKRVWNIFFSEKNREKWIVFLCEEFDIMPDEAAFILSRLNYLPASKRKPEDTFWALTSSNMVHTEFGNHQENVRLMAEKEDFSILDFVESIRDPEAPDIAKRLGAMKDFVAAHEINEDIAELLEVVGIEENFGGRGHTQDDWENFGSVKKTSAEFRAAYEAFRDRAVKMFSSAANRVC